MGNAEIPESPKPLSSGSWAGLISRARTGCRDAFDILSRNCWTYLVLAAREELGRGLDKKMSASDLVQQTLIMGYAKIEQFKGRTDRELIGWLKMILRHQAASAGRFFRQSPRSANGVISINGLDVAELNAETPSKKMMSLEGRQQILEVIQGLPDFHREVLQLHLFDGHTFEEIGRRTGKTTDAVRKVWVSALRSLKKRMPKDDHSGNP